MQQQQKQQKVRGGGRIMESYIVWLKITLKTQLVNIVEDRFKNYWTLMSVLYYDVQKGQ